MNQNIIIGCFMGEIAPLMFRKMMPVIYNVSYGHQPDAVTCITYAIIKCTFVRY